MSLTPAQRERYHRQIIIPAIGEEGQEKLLSKTVTVVGQGGLGSPVSLYLVAAGVGTLRIVDNDIVSVSNLQRQVLYTSDDVDADKVVAAKKRLKSLNGDVKVEAIKTAVTAENVGEITAGSDVVVDCSDNFGTKYLVNDTAVSQGIPAVISGVQDFQGQLLVVKPGETACYRCVFGDPPAEREPDTRGPLPIIGATAGVFGCLEASETLKLLLNLGKSLAGSLLMMDLSMADFMKIDVKRNESCAACGERKQ
ncbi:MAG: HesA/MoeB/ThiF family protein [Promethearchaeota archaeon]